MEIGLSNWGVEFAFVRTQVGSEFAVVEACGKTPLNDRCRFFGTYGYFDLAAISTFNSLNDPYHVLLDRRIAESAPFRFFADSTNAQKSRFESDLDSWPAAIAILAKINSKICFEEGGNARWKVVKMVRREFPSAHVFFGLGHSELLITTGGTNLPDLLKAVTGRLRILVDESSQPNRLFSKTTTFPLLSCAQIHSSQNYDILEGEFEPVVTASCEPAAERLIAQELGQEGLVVRNVYGKNDLLIAWKEPIKISKLAQFLTKFREKWGGKCLLSKTTTYLESSVSYEPHASDVSSDNCQDNGSLSDLMTETEEADLFRMLAKIESQSLRAALSDLALRLSACLHDPQLTPHYLDMANVFALMPDLVESLGKPDLAFNASFTAEAIADLARGAMNQRYAGLELHPETLAHAHAPLLCDIRTIVAGATCIPHYIFDNLIPDKSASEVWAGFVLFGGSNSPQHLPNDILGLPPSSLFSPIFVWWKITHEVAHVIFKTLEVYEKIPERIRHYAAESFDESGVTGHHIINELFANWFDWKYIFRKDIKFYLDQIWSSWVQFPIVSRDKAQYLARSFSVFICPRLDELITTLPQRWDQGGLPWMRERWGEFTSILAQIPGMPQYLSDLSSQEIDETISLTFASSGILNFYEKSFESKCGVEGLQARLAPQYTNLEHHVKLLMEGHVIVDRIPDPCRLHLETLKALGGIKPSLATEIAYLFSLENTYLIAYRSRRKK